MLRLVFLISLLWGLFLIVISGLLFLIRSPEPLYFLAFLSNQDGNSEIYRINPDGSGLKQLTFTDRDGHCWLEWNPDGGIDALYGPTEGGGRMFCYHGYGNLIRMSAAGKGRHSLLNENSHPVARFENWLIFVRDVYDDQGHYFAQIYRRNIQTWERENIGSAEQWWFGSRMYVAGDWLIFTDDRDTDYFNEIYRLNLNNTVIFEPLADPDYLDICEEIALLPNNRIFFLAAHRGVDEECTRLYQTSVSGWQQDLKHFINLPHIPHGLIPSPDGKWLAYWISQNAASTYNIYVMSPDDGSIYPVISHLNGFATDSLVWSPDSQQLVFATFSESSAILNLHRIYLDGSHFKPLTHFSGEATQPRYSPPLQKPFSPGQTLGIGLLFLTSGLFLKRIFK